MLPLIIIILLSLFILGVIWRRKRDRQHKQARIQQLRTWAAHHQAIEPTLQQWMLRLPAAEAEVLLDLLNGYCTSLNWELGWLFAPQIEKAPALQAALAESVSAYAQTILRSLQMAEDVRAYHAYLAFDKKPTARKHRELVQQLYAKIDNQGATAPAKKFFRRFGKKTATRQQQIDAIRQAFERDPAHTMALLKETLLGEAGEVILQVRSERTPPMLSVPASATA